MDVLLLTYANSRENPLPTLTKEDDSVFKVLVNRQLKGHFLIHRESFVTLEKINTYLDKYQDVLTVFLYSGHADGRTLLLDGEEANAKGIARQLGRIATNGKLRLVVLNGCSTKGQVNALLDMGVPVVIATSAAVDDHSATEFSIRFFQCLSEKRLNIREAFTEALGPAQTTTPRDLEIISPERGLSLDKIAGDEPVWGLFTLRNELLEENPLSQGRQLPGKTNFIPNEELTKTLFTSLLDAGCRDIQNLQERESEGEYVEIGDKQITIVNVLPFPVATHLQKLLCPVTQENRGFDKVSISRLEQTGTLYQITVEFTAFIMLSQLWELKLQGKISTLPSTLIQIIKAYFYLSRRERAIFDYLPFIREIRLFFDSLDTGNGVPYFITELNYLKELVQQRNEFASACSYLSNLRQQTVAGRIPEADVPDMCQEAENHLCIFLKELAFLHQYTLTSIQNIDIRKYRHQVDPIFSHEAVKLMRAFGEPEQNYYLLPSFLDNRGVALLKGKWKLVDYHKREFTGSRPDFLNLSPFIIDRHAFEANTDLTSLLFFDEIRRNESEFRYKSVKRPDRQSDVLEVREDGPFEAVFLQLQAFQEMILNEKR